MLHSIILIKENQRFKPKPEKVCYQSYAPDGVKDKRTVEMSFKERLLCAIQKESKEISLKRLKSFEPEKEWLLHSKTDFLNLNFSYIRGLRLKSPYERLKQAKVLMWTKTARAKAKTFLSMKFRLAVCFKILDASHLFRFLTLNRKKMIIGKTIKSIRKQRGLSQSDLAERVKMSKPYISEIESGKKIPSIEYITLICKALDVPVSMLFFNAIDKEDFKGKGNKEIINEIQPLIEKVSDLFNLKTDDNGNLVSNKTRNAVFV